MPAFVVPFTERQYQRKVPKVPSKSIRIVQPRAETGRKECPDADTRTNRHEGRTGRFLRQTRKVA